ncbi:MAG: hypothetical protein RUMPE_01000 [Eubacteriales bacterium SKADARSKE-1]|nr:hypothetical protein [Eubacteriales bacterium SKADARSKE-1]
MKKILLGILIFTMAFNLVGGSLSFAQGVNNYKAEDKKRAHAFSQLCMESLAKLPSFKKEDIQLTEWQRFNKCVEKVELMSEEEKETSIKKMCHDYYEVQTSCEDDFRRLPLDGRAMLESLGVMIQELCLPVKDYVFNKQ